MVAVLLGTFVVLVVVFAAIFHAVMAQEGQNHSWATAFYWTLVTMTTLGFGDITFTSDLGRIFSVIVLLTGTAFLLILLPFAFIQFVFVPWMNRRDASRAPRPYRRPPSGIWSSPGWVPSKTPSSAEPNRPTWTTSCWSPT